MQVFPHLPTPKAAGRDFSRQGGYEIRQFLKIRDLVRPELRYYAFGLTALILADLMQLITPQILRLFVDTVTGPHATMPKLLPYGLAMVAAGLLILVLRFFWRTNCFGASRRIEYRLRRRLFGHLTGLSATFFNHHKVGDLMAHATNDVQAVRMSFAMGIVASVDSAFLILSTVVIMFGAISPSLALFALLPLPVSAIVAGSLGRVIHRRFVKVQAAFADMTDDVQENFSGIRVVKGFAQEEPELRKFLGRSQAYVRRNMELVRVWGLFDPLVDAIGGISFAIATAYGGYLVLMGRLQLGEFVAFLYYLGLLRGPMAGAGWVINVLQRGAASMERLNSIFAVESEIQQRPDARPLPAPRGAIAVRGLTFAYAPALPPALENVSFELEPGQTLGVIGPKLEPGQTLGVIGPIGSGKSTLANLLLRVYEAPGGTITLDGHDIQDLRIEDVRAACGYAPQDAFLFSETIAENISFARPDADRALVERAARQAAVHDNIVLFPQGYDTLVGERGVTLSGGQKQRVAIARALVQDPPVLLLDDSLSAVDTQTEARILAALREERKGRTNVIIAHRISAISHADLILFLEDGRVVERGRHQDLLRLGGRYKALYDRQLLEERILHRAEEGA
jgi:ATP-binding cassette subfamily B protein